MKHTTSDIAKSVSRDGSIFKRWFSVVGLLFFSAPLWGIIFSFVELFRAFSSNVEGDDFQANISGALDFMVVVNSLGIFGVICVFIALFGIKLHEAWFYRWVIFLSLPWCLIFFPFGILICLAVLSGAIKSKGKRGQC